MNPPRPPPSVQASDPPPEPVLADLGAVCREFRTERGLTQQQIATLAEVHRVFVAEVEAGRENVSFATLARLLRGVGKSWIEFGRALDRSARARIREP